MDKSVIVSPLPGIFYRTPSPDLPKYCEVGDTIKAGSVIGVVEVMKSFHEVRADVGGKIEAFLIENEDPVMAGQPLVKLER
ncbi:acetyl-CoA carboxylase [Enterovibrio norvegicus]|uniref:Biotin carboxyl carrier protein of acetyl-CoA carboxylase n=1 Tax=Enterovibrio norvegicus TaxID=188144 RepID=A0A2N7LFX2_9GAMM|nr:acetyl-CoA carboxylase [Enterovibrio norvegicus]PML81925.1 acetyl-CoA carboxylase biotin carboxyl carrier protein subunit [Enterovibrio norvegicus]PMN72215.1 acetyl-CoA carboxylase biotin carboxyl carrier protein subunit [Enterovibrio norvegicus]PMN94428.1 acetyl-CoA carboxylase biotin carboxyl carrier protein subunit [Enterovibrio norvegicus]